MENNMQDETIDIFSDLDPSADDTVQDEIDLKETQTDPENKENPEKETGDEKDEPENQETEIPEKYKNEDGSLNINLLLADNADFLKQKDELETKANLAEQLKNEREEFAKNLGFKDYETLLSHQKEQKTSIEQAQFEAGEYAKFLHTVSNPEDVRSMLIQYSQSPNPFLLKQIEAEFAPEVIKTVARANERYDIQKENEAKAQEYANYQTEAREFITDAVTRHKDMFQDSAFKELFRESIRFAGNRFSSDELVRIVNNIKQNAIQEYIKEQNQKKENQDLTNGLIDNAPTAKKSNSNIPNNILEMNEEELAAVVKEAI